MHMPSLRLVEPANQTKQTAFARAVVANQTDAVGIEHERHFVQHDGATAYQSHLFKRNVGAFGV
jgi:conjugal transfer/entry exclusion protein